MSVDLLLIHPNGRSGIYQGLAADLAAVEPPLWCAMLATYVRQKGHSVAIIDAEAERLSPEAVAGRVATIFPLVAAVVAYGHQPSASTQVMPAASATIRAIHALDLYVFTMLLGGHVAALPERTLREVPVDLVCTGDGPITLHELLTELREGSASVIQKARGLVGAKDFVLTGRTPDAPLVENLDAEIPEPAYDLLPMHLYRAHNWHCLGGRERSGYASLYTTLGCPFSCAFCCIQAPFRSGESLRVTPSAGSGGKAARGTLPVEGSNPPRSTNSYRRWSPPRVGQTLENLARRGIRNVKIADEMFVLNRSHVEGICDEIIRRKLDLNLWAYARTDTVRDGMPEKLKAAGFNWLAFGIESGSVAVRNASDKELAEEEIRETISRVRFAGIHVIANYIFGLPGETMASMQQTLDLAMELNCEFGNFYSAMAYPGSPLYTEVLAKRPLDLPPTWAGYSQHGLETVPLRTEALTAKEILTFRDAAFRLYHSSERYLTMIFATFGEAGVTEVKRMLGAKLERCATCSTAGE